MSKKIKLQDLSISKFDQQPDVEGIKGGINNGAYNECWTRYYRLCLPRWINRTQPYCARPPFCLYSSSE